MNHKATSAVNVGGVEFQFVRGLWLGAVSTRSGKVEVLFSGSESAPNEAQVDAYRRFAKDLDANTARLRKEISFGFLFRPIRIAVNQDNRVGVQFLNRLTGNQGQLILDKPLVKNLRAVPGAGVFASRDGKVLYNLLTPHMQQFLGRCVSAVKKAGIKAKGTGQFSILLGDSRTEL